MVASQLHCCTSGVLVTTPGSEAVGSTPGAMGAQ